MAGNKKITSKEILLTVKEFVEMWASEGDISGALTEDTDIIKEVGLDSIGVLHLLANLERAFGITIQNDEIAYESIAIVKNLIALVESKSNENYRPVKE